MTTPRLSPAMRNLLHAAITHGQLPLHRSVKTVPTAQALRRRGLLDADNRPTQAGRDVFSPAPPERRPGIEAVYQRVRAEQPNWSEAHAATHAKYLYTTKGVTC